MKHKTNAKTLVIFRRFKGEDIAVFPYEPGTNDPCTMQAFSAKDGHFTIHRDVVQASTKLDWHQCQYLCQLLWGRDYKLSFSRFVPKDSFAVRLTKINSQQEKV